MADFFTLFFGSDAFAADSAFACFFEEASAFFFTDAAAVSFAEEEALDEEDFDVLEGEALEEDFPGAARAFDAALFSLTFFFFAEDAADLSETSALEDAFNAAFAGAFALAENLARALEFAWAFG